MRIIRKFEDGGGMPSANYFVMKAPVQNPSDSTSSSSSDKSSGDSTKGSPIPLLSDAAYKYLIENGGLPNDADAFFSQLEQLSNQQNNPFASQDNGKLAISILKEINDLRSNKDSFNKAIESAKASDSLEDVAVSNDGSLFVKGNNNNIMKVSLNEYQKIKGKVRPLTLAELMNERQMNPNLTNDQSTINIAQSSVGISKVSEYLHNLISYMGKSSSTTDRMINVQDAKSQLAKLTGRAPNNLEVQGLEDMYKAAADNDSDFSEIKMTNAGNRPNSPQALKAAMGYIVSSLSEGMKNKIYATAAINGISPQYMIQNILMNQTYTESSLSSTPVEDKGFSRERDMAYDLQADEQKFELGLKQKQYEALNAPTKISPIEAFTTGKWRNPNDIYEYNNPNSNMKINMIADARGPLFSLVDGKTAISPAMLSTILNQGNYNSILNSNNIYIGEDRIQPSAANQLAYDGKDVAKVYVPVTASGAPDLLAEGKFSNVYNMFKAQRNKLSVNDAKRLFANAGFNNIGITRSPNGQLDIDVSNSNVKPFLAMGVYTNTASNISDSKYMLKINNKDEASNANNIMKEAFTVGSGKNKKDYTPSGWFSSPVKGTVFIPYRWNANEIVESQQGHYVGNTSGVVNTQYNLQHGNALKLMQ